MDRARPLSPRRAVLLGGLVVGVLDGLYAVIALALRGLRPLSAFQAIAGGIMGRPAALAGGIRTVLLGLVLHFVIATSVVLVYWLASRRLEILVRYPVRSGILYGALVYLVMYGVVIPLSAIDRPLFTISPSAGPILCHLFLVGIPTALIVRLAHVRSTTPLHPASVRTQSA